MVVISRCGMTVRLGVFFFNDTATTEIYTLSLHDALPISTHARGHPRAASGAPLGARRPRSQPRFEGDRRRRDAGRYQDRKSTRLNSSHANISYAVFCLKKKKVSLPSLSVPSVQSLSIPIA